jgi:hypothetical protein
MHVVRLACQTVTLVTLAATGCAPKTIVPIAAETAVSRPGVSPPVIDDAPKLDTSPTSAHLDRGAELFAADPRRGTPPALDRTR